MRAQKSLFAVIIGLSLAALPASAQEPNSSASSKPASGAADPSAKDDGSAEQPKPPASSEKVGSDQAPAEGDSGADGDEQSGETAAEQEDAAGDAEPEAAEKGPSSVDAASDKKSAEPTAAAAPAQPEIDGSTYVVRLRDLEARVDELKEQIRRSHTRLSLLSDTILSGGVGGSRAEIKFRNEMSSAFRVVRALFVLDGAVQYNKQDNSGALSSQKEIPIFKGSIPPGDHTLQVLVQLRGHGYGVFSYLRGYQFEVKSSHSFTVTEGKTVHLDAIAWEKGGVTTALEQRPAVRYAKKVQDGVNVPGSTPAGSGKKPRAKVKASAGGK